MYRKTILKAALLLACVVCFPGVSCARRPIRALIVTGQNNHNWPVSHRALQAILQNSGLFAVDLRFLRRRAAIWMLLIPILAPTGW